MRKTTANQMTVYYLLFTNIEPHMATGGLPRNFENLFPRYESRRFTAVPITWKKKNDSPCSLYDDFATIYFQFVVLSWLIYRCFTDLENKPEHSPENQTPVSNH